MNFEEFIEQTAEKMRAIFNEEFKEWQEENLESFLDMLIKEKNKR